MTDQPLPPPGTERWTAKRKARLVAAIAAGEITSERVLTNYHISPEELASWQRLNAKAGAPGLRTTRLKDYR